MSDLPTVPDLYADVVRRIVTVTDELTYFGENSAGGAIALSAAQLVAGNEATARALLRRQTLLGSSGDALVEVASEFGATQLGPTRATVPVILRPQKTTVTAITSGRIEVADSSLFAVADSIRLTTNDGSNSEVCTVLAITTASGPSGGDELDVGLIVGSYDPDADTVLVLLRKTKAAGTRFRSTAGITFESLKAITVGDSNPAMAGESSALALADKVWCEATVAGAAGDVEALTITALETPDADIASVLNPMRASGGGETESDPALKYRTAHLPQRGASETPAMLETLALLNNRDVLRAYPDTGGALGIMRLRVLSRAGGGLSTDALLALGAAISARLRSGFSVECLNMEVTAVEVVADVTLDPGAGTNAERLAAAWRNCADALANFLDFRTWPIGGDVDEADLLSLVNAAEGIATVATSSFEPAANVDVAAVSLPVLTRLVLRDTASGETFGADLEASYA